MRVPTRARSALPAATDPRRDAATGPMLPSRVRADPDRIVGFACAALLPLALWLAGA